MDRSPDSTARCRGLPAATNFLTLDGESIGAWVDDGPPETESGAGGGGIKFRRRFDLCCGWTF
jgi:hypothetical protein